MKVVIFDFDGVIADTMQLHNVIEHDILTRYGCDITVKRLITHYGGVPFRDKVRQLIKGESVDFDALVDEKEERMMQEAENKVLPVEGAVELIHLLTRNDYRLAIGSSAKKKFLLKVLKNLDLDSYFETIVTLDDVVNGKPNPDIFLKAAELLSVTPSDCIVIEDGLSGIEAAKRAGMKTIFKKVDESQICDADKIVWSLKDLGLDDFYF